MKSLINKTINWEIIIGILIPSLVMLFVQTHSVPVLMVSFVLSFLYLRRPLVLFPVMFLTSLNTNLFMIIPGLSCGLIFMVLMIVSLTLNISSTDERLRKRYAGWVILLLLINLFMSSISIIGSFDTFFKMFQSLLLFYLLSLQQKIDVRNIIYSLAGAVTVCVAIMLGAFLSGKMVINELGRFSTEGVNENGLAMVFSQCSIILIFAFFYINSRIQKGIYIVTFFVALFLLLLSGSRSAMLGSLVGSFFIIAFYYLSLKKSRTYTFPIIIISLIAYVGVTYVMDMDLKVLERFTVDNMIEGRGTERLDRREYLLKNVFPEHPIFGIGLGSENEYAVTPDGPCHNIIIDPLIQIGLFGITIYWIFIAQVMVRSRKYIRKNLEIILPLALFVACLINGIGEIVFWEKFFWNSISMTVLFVNYLNSKRIAIVR